MITTVPVSPMQVNNFPSHSPSEWEFFIKPLDKLASANYNIDKKLAETNTIRKELCSMMIHPMIQSVGALIGGLVTLGLFVYNIASLFSGSRSCSGAGCPIK